MKIISESKVDPDLLSKLDRKSNIIMCIDPNDGQFLTESESFPDTFKISLPKDINLSAQDVIKVSTSALAATFKPAIKISLPAGLKIQFSEFVDSHNQDIFWKIYKSFNLMNTYTLDNIIQYHLITNMTFVMNMDTIRMREVGTHMLLKKETPIIDFYFTWYVQTKRDMPQIEEIYLISDGQVYEDFMNII